MSFPNMWKRLHRPVSHEGGAGSNPGSRVPRRVAACPRLYLGIWHTSSGKRTGSIWRFYQSFCASCIHDNTISIYKHQRPTPYICKLINYGVILKKKKASSGVLQPKQVRMPITCTVCCSMLKQHGIMEIVTLCYLLLRLHGASRGYEMTSFKICLQSTRLSSFETYVVCFLTRCPIQLVGWFCVKFWEPQTENTIEAGPPATASEIMLYHYRWLTNKFVLADSAERE